MTLYTSLYEGHGIEGEGPIGLLSSAVSKASAPFPANSTGRGRAERAYQALRRAIQEGVIEPGQRVREQDLCDWLLVSRTPVREALRRLQSEGLLVHAPGGGLAVACHDLRAVTELYDIRERLEGTAAGFAARQADETELRMLQALVDAHRDLGDDPQLHASENLHFHEALYKAAHNRFLLQTLRSLHNSVALLGRTTFTAPGRIAEAIDEHQAIVTAIARRNEKEAEDLTRLHIRRAYEIRLRTMAEGPRVRLDGVDRAGARPFVPRPEKTPS
jgi:DNA-binding GntR family transcriptional regulator